VRGHWFVLGAAILWGTAGTAQALTPAGYDPAAIGALRLLIGGLALLLLALSRQELQLPKGWHWLPLLLAAALTSSYQLCYFSAVAKTGVAVGTVVAMGSAPIAGGLLGLIFRGERPGRRWYLATPLAIGGCILLGFSGGEVTVDPLGILLAFGAGCSYAAYALAIKGLLDKYSPNALIAIVVCLGALILSPALLRIEVDWLMQPSALLAALYLGLATLALSYWLFARGLQTVQVAGAVTLTLIEPLTAALLGIFVLGEFLNLQAFAGIGLIFSGLVMLIIKQRPPSAIKENWREAPQ
jgi:drug/metabolite transporter, DME family